MKELSEKIYPIIISATENREARRRETDYENLLWESLLDQNQPDREREWKAVRNLPIIKSGIEAILKELNQEVFQNQGRESGWHNLQETIYDKNTKPVRACNSCSANFSWDGFHVNFKIRTQAYKLRRGLLGEHRYAVVHPLYGFMQITVPNHGIHIPLTIFKLVNDPQEMLSEIRAKVTDAILNF